MASAGADVNAKGWGGRFDRLGRRPAVAAALVFAVAWAILEVGHPPAPVHADVFEDLLDARACIESHVCRTAGARTSLASVHQGALWINLLAVLRDAGLSVDAIHAFTLALAGFGAALVFLALARRSSGVALATASLAALGLVLGGSLHVPWNPSLTPLPSALLFALAIAWVDAAPVEIRLGWGAVPLGLALGLTVESHPVAALVVPGAMLLAGVACRRAWLAAIVPVVVAAIALALYAGVSPEAATGNAAAAFDALGLAIWVGLASLVAAAVALRGRFADLSGRTRRVLAAAALALPPLVALGGRALFFDDAPVGARYLAPAAFPIAYLIAEAAAPLLARPRVALALVALTLIGAAVAREPRSDLSFADVEAARAMLEREDGMRFDAALARVSGPACGDVVGALAAVGMSLRPSGAERLPPADLVLLPAGALEAGGVSADDLGEGRWRRANHGRVLIGEREHWVDRRRFGACIETEGGGAGEAPTCVEIDLGDGARSLLGSGAPILSRLAVPSASWTDGSGPRRAVRRVVYRLSVRIPAGAGRRTVSVPRGGEVCRTRFVRAEGVRTASSLPAESMELVATDEAQEGALTIEVERRDCGRADLPVFPPCLWERTPEEASR